MYKRLTQRDEKKPYIIRTKCENCGRNGNQCSGWDCAQALAERLAKYEDSGYSPEALIDADIFATWVSTDESGIYTCTHCGFPDTQPEFRKRCSNCGAKMRGIDCERRIESYGQGVHQNGV